MLDTIYNIWELKLDFINFNPKTPFGSAESVNPAVMTKGFTIEGLVAGRILKSTIHCLGVM